MNLDAPVNVAELAELLGVHRHTIEGWIKDGLPASRGPVAGGPVIALLRPAVQWIRKRDEDRYQAAIEKARGGDEDSSKARKLAAEARLKEMTVAEREGKLVDVSEVEAAWEQQTTAVRESVMTVSGALVQGTLIRAEDEAKVEGILRDALTNAAARLEAELKEVDG